MWASRPHSYKNSIVAKSAKRFRSMARLMLCARNGFANPLHGMVDGTPAAPHPTSVFIRVHPWFKKYRIHASRFLRAPSRANESLVQAASPRVKHAARCRCAVVASNAPTNQASGCTMRRTWRFASKNSLANCAMAGASTSSSFCACSASSSSGNS